MEAVFFAFDELKPYEARLAGATCTAVETRGKAMLTRFDNALTLYSHNQLYGRWYTGPRGRLPQTNRSLRVALHTAERSALLYSASEVEVLNAEAEAAHPFLNRVGPDILDRGLTAADIERRLGEQRFRRRSLAALYLDQGFLAGVGNYLRSEILHRAGLHPALRPVDIGEDERNRLAAETLAIARRSYRTGGVTLTDARAREAREESGRSERFWVFSRAGKPCRDCGRRIERAELSGRRIYFCARCQPSG